MKNLPNKILIIAFVGFISLSLLLTAVFNFGDITSSLYENKDKVLNYETAFSTVSSSFSENLILIDNYADIYGGIQRLQSREVWINSEGDSYLLAEDGKIYTCAFFQSTDIESYEVTDSERREIEKCSEAISEFAKEVQNRDAEFFFVQAPARYDPNYVSTKLHITASKAKSVELLAKLLKDDENINLLNTQSYFHEQNMPFEDWFYRTDTHWTSETAFAAYAELCRRINSETDIEIDESFFDRNNWNFETFESAFLGAYGRTVGEGFAGKDDIDIASPKFETDCKKTSAKSPHTSIDAGGGNVVEGSYKDAVIDQTLPAVTYGSYVGNDICEVRIENKKAATDKKILIIKDSFALPVSAFLSTCFAETRLLDLRYFHDGVLDYIDEYEPDIVLVLYHPGDYNTETFFNFK